ncbi:MAG TPA: hypothetical protein VMR99_00680 [Candidatus Paceibacterota bacterium]|nr:hypothetical protein [Candidatus Paceibacterota bacterium]
MAKKKKATKRANHAARAWEIGGAITAATIAAAAGAYLLSDKKTKTKAKKWAMEARKEVVKKAKVAKKLGEKEYHRLVEEAVKHHGSLEHLTAGDMMKAAKELKAEWKKIQAEAKKMAKSHGPKKAMSKKKPAHKAKAKKRA